MGLIDLAKPKSGTPGCTKGTIKRKRICFSWISNTKYNKFLACYCSACGFKLFFPVKTEQGL